MQREFSLGNKRQLQFRAEFFNLPNHTNFGRPSATLFTSSAGRINSTATTPRQFQFAIPATDSKFFPDALAQIAYKLQTANQGIGQGWDYEDTRSPRAVQFNVAVQRQLGESQVISVGYTGNRTDRSTTYGYYHLPPPYSMAFPTNTRRMCRNSFPNTRRSLIRKQTENPGILACCSHSRNGFQRASRRRFPTPSRR